MRPICSDVKHSVAKYLEEQLHVSPFKNDCILTLPIKTLDGRWVSVFVEQSLDNSFLVHDGGKTDSELFSQGVKMTDVDSEMNAAIAAKYGAIIKDRMLQRLCRHSELAEAILSVGQCAAVLATQLIWTPIELEENRAYREVDAALARWQPADASIEKDVKVEGISEKHTLNFVARRGKYTTAINVLSSRRGRSLEKARDYDYSWLDMERSPNEYRACGRLAVIPNAETWSDKALGIVKGASHDTIALPTDREEELRERIPESVSKLNSPAFLFEKKTPFSLYY